ncbi:MULTISPECIES: CS1 type fimbrial major subunit [Pseudomonadota]|uniref:CS1 type fimbrial major subunit n=1 Tax=Pseudomonadota TaxID=1224 RepID=UPI0012AA2FC4|nr:MULTISPECIES: CS1 type fimbrial major subunit [Pseudomonadota]MBP8322105.1 hypothetical protein [Pseudomonas aeruginosa]MCZ8438910.1 CS1 type fimbrial major subunit [Achromobacter xylosoxidans]MDC6162367.1 CS1 type fimbrial major subunit [Achromobacter xylosoxidans]CUR68080.1 CS1 pilin [Achromobacter xylosoxidans]
MKFKKTIYAAALLGALASSAAMADTYKEITVTAKVDPTLDLQMSDMTKLPDNVTMLYDPAHGLHPVKLTTRLLTNKSATGEHALGGINIRLNGDANLQLNGATSNTVPLTITYAGKKLSKTDTLISKDDLQMGSDGKAHASKPLELQISQATQAVISPAGDYSGVVGLILSEQLN